MSNTGGDGPIREKGSGFELQWLVYYGKQLDAHIGKSWRKSRYGWYEDVLRRHFTSLPTLTSTSIAKVLLAEREVASMLRVLSQAPRDVDRLASWKTKLFEMCDGPLTEPSGSNSSKAWSTVSEMLFYAAAEDANLRPDFVEPDIVMDRFLGSSSKLSVAVKRVRSHRQLLRRFNEAASQIGRGRYPGAVYLDVLPEEQQHAIVAPSFDAALDEVDKVAIKCSTRVNEHCVRHACAHNVHLHVVNVTLFCRIPEGWTSLSSQQFGPVHRRSTLRMVLGACQMLDTRRFVRACEVASM